VKKINLVKTWWFLEGEHQEVFYIFKFHQNKCFEPTFWWNLCVFMVKMVQKKHKIKTWWKPGDFCQNLVIFSKPGENLVFFQNLVKKINLVKTWWFFQNLVKTWWFFKILVKKITLMKTGGKTGDFLKTGWIHEEVSKAWWNPGDFFITWWKSDVFFQTWVKKILGENLVIIV
jgi:hypothetical protein